MKSKIMSEYRLYATWTSEALLDCSNVHKPFYKTFKKMQILAISKVLVSCLVSVQNPAMLKTMCCSPIQVKIFSLIIFPIFETSLKRHQKSVV